MKKQKVRTKKLVIPHWQARLFISLFYADGGDGYIDKEIEETAQIINEEHLLSLVSVSEPRDGECTMEFITNY
ncbi:MAG TPA: hypothetical protein PKC55_10520 [Dysgonomonas sp.]|uniref:hypothetical protein n=1 Tax=unclassified Dysgonomonas TaxID=2630389 RepID=UPI0025BDE73E|nr:MULTISPECIES: hypothetical protein [unclassified Dysgonomonas]HML65254.1 hypothetical protein [Dysgonomonas sp.]